MTLQILDLLLLRDNPKKFYAVSPLVFSLLLETWALNIVSFTVN